MKRQISIQSFFANSPKRKKNYDDEDARPTNTENDTSTNTKESDEIDKQSCTSNPRLPENQSPNELTTWLCRTLKDDEKYTLYTNGLTIPDHFKFPYTKIGDRNRCFQRDWMNKYPGLVYSIAEDGAYCLHCALFENEPEKRGKLVNGPFKNWKKALEVFDEHFNGKNTKNLKRGGTGYQRHMQCVTKGEMFCQQVNRQTNVHMDMNHGLRDRKEKNLKVLESIVKTILICGRQNLALRGHRDDSKHIGADNLGNVGNFQALLDFRIDAGDTILAEHFKTAPKNATYRSKTVQNEIIEIIGTMIRKHIIKDITDRGGHFSVSADEVRDISNSEQLAVCLRFVDLTGAIRDEFVNFIEVSDDTTGERLSEELLKVLPEMGLDLNLMRSQCYDGAGNMTGHLKGVGPRIQRQYPKALHFWCTAHQLNRCIVAAANIPCIRNMMGTADKVVQFFNWSPKRQSILEEKLDMVQNDNKRMKLKELCRTRWVERHDAFETFWDFLPAIIDAMEKIKSIDKSPAAVSDTQSLENNITSFQFLVSLLVTMRCIGYLKQLSVSLQGRAVDVVTALRSVNLVKEALQDVRTNIDSFHGKWYNEVKNLAEELDITPAKPRTCGRQTKRSNVPSETTEDYFKKTIAIPLLDHILTEMNSRFGDLQVKASMGLQVLPSMMANSGNFDLDYFMDDLPSPSTLEQELHMWKLKWAQDNDPPSDIQSAIENCNKTLFPNIHKILTICGVFPVTSCECERSISKLRLVKTYLRSTMSTSRASSLILLYIHRNITIEATEVVKKYAMSNPRRMTFPDILSE